MSQEYEIELRRLDDIARCVLDGRHGSFVTAFAEAWLRVDHENKDILWPVWERLIEKYDLADELVAVFEA